MLSIPFNSPFSTGNEWQYIQDACKEGKLAADGKYTNKCQQFFEKKYGFGKAYLTHSCTQALEMAALLMDLKPGDELIVPSYTYVSTANAFALRGCKIVFVDSRSDYPGIDELQLEHLINDKTRAIVAVHYGGIACDMDLLTSITKKHNLFLIEDAAAAIDSYYLGADKNPKPLGSFGHFATFSFHETKNISCGEGGMLVVNDANFLEKADEVWNRGTNKKAFISGQRKKYEWVSLGSAFAPSEINAAWLWAQLEEMDAIQEKREKIWNWQQNNLPNLLAHYDLDWMNIPSHSIHNFHLFYGLAKSLKQRDELLNHLRQKGILAVFHYQSLHASPYNLSLVGQGQRQHLIQADKYSERLIRFPLYTDLDTENLRELISS
ncbi:dTDP-4-amino-4,6-dideoxygalactose transaminase [Cyclobacterium qasimii]|uniref:4-keto-6-deoxy-N-Acetyl-D-hexosaminyl-(Lipid carrier) aminotransferase n=2 Tax=Cyclobacterium qasimii TaxID=1350429 RepID=S7WGF3_9BACT|nr:dTDP-4-amino-4,6-dideoxygalactose transaminase [Cyclobacterium qasimii]EPR65844.1 4-keto-6-deoxy-N-Acetyl-D-hexosaminyl-(Lipid carrier) aminotransferase [Cyclobacterium qasimii M12-11B]GEO23279.1 dTDP-4-amino-4,6-dideoxy-D-glucose transaminase [Cyclobacterium qasimii]